MTTNVLQREVDTETKRGSRLITGVFLWVYSVIPFFYGDTIPVFVVATAVFCIFEGIVHMAGIKYDYTFGPLLFIASFAMMQRTMMAMVGMCYKDMFAAVRNRSGK